MIIIRGGVDKKIAKTGCREKSKVVNEYKHLGVIVTSNLSMNVHLKDIWKM